MFHIILILKLVSPANVCKKMSSYPNILHLNEKIRGVIFKYNAVPNDYLKLIDYKDLSIIIHYTSMFTEDSYLTFYRLLMQHEPSH